MAIVFVGIDLAKNLFAVHGVDAAGRVALQRPAVPRDKLLALVAELGVQAQRHCVVHAGHRREGAHAAAVAAVGIEHLGSRRCKALASAFRRR